MPRVKRHDVVTLREPRRLDDGRVIYDALLSRTGIQVYDLVDGDTVRTIREWRSPKEVFSPESLATFMGAAVVYLHPPGETGVTADNYRDHLRGVCLSEPVRVDEPDASYTRAPIVVYDADLQEKISSGVVQISLGYEADVTLGEIEVTLADGTKARADASQGNIRVNHVAVVPQGRAGAKARVRADSLEIVSDQTIPALPEQGRPMEKIEIGGVSYDVPPEVRAYLEELKQELAAAQAQQDAATKAQQAAAVEAAAAKADAAAARAKADGATAAIPGEVARQLAEARERDRLRARLDSERVTIADGASLLDHYVAAVKAAGFAAFDPAVAGSDQAAQLAAARAALAGVDAVRKTHRDALTAENNALLTPRAAPVGLASAAHEAMQRRQQQAFGGAK